jgi:hypothetical protein
VTATSATETEDRKAFDDRVNNQLSGYQGIMCAGAAMLWPIFHSVNRYIMVKKGIFAVTLMLPICCIVYNLWNFVESSLYNLIAARAMYICFFTLNFAVNRAIWYAVPENVKGMACLVVNNMLPCVAQGLGAFGALGLQRAGVAADSPLLTLSMIGGSFVWMAALHFKAKKGY